MHMCTATVMCSHFRGGHVLWVSVWKTSNVTVISTLFVDKLFSAVSMTVEKVLEFVKYKICKEILHSHHLVYCVTKNILDCSRLCTHALHMFANCLSFVKPFYVMRYKYAFIIIIYATLRSLCQSSLYICF